MEAKTHWKKLVNPDYLGAYSLTPGQELVLTIKNIVREKVTGTGGKKQECTVAHFVEQQKPMILNRLNSKVITRIYGTPYIEEWAGKKIQVFAAMVDAFGEQVEALRIRDFIPKDSEVLLVWSEQVNATKTIEELETLWKQNANTIGNDKAITDLFTAKKKKFNGV